MVFQDPYSSLNPRMTVADIIGEGLDIHRRYASREDRANQISEMLKKVAGGNENCQWNCNNDYDNRINSPCDTWGK